MIDIIEKNIGSHIDVEQGNQYMYSCPACGHKNNRLSINYDKNMFHCWTCGFSGKNIIGILYYVKAPKSDIEDVKSFLGNKDVYEGNSKISELEYDIYRMLDSKGEKKESKGGNLLEINTWKPVWKPKDIFEIRAYKYLKSRGLSKYDMMLYNIQYDISTNSIDIPSYDDSMRLNYYVKHYFDTSYYENPDGVSKMNIIFNEYSIDFSQPIYITEGFYDAVTIGFNAVPILGKFVPKPLIQKIIMSDTPHVFICMDGDARAEATKLFEYLNYLGISNSILDIPKDHDPNSLGREKLEPLLSEKKIVSFGDKINNLLENK